MTNRYVRSTDGNNADSGATWALAKATLAGAAAIAVAGDVIYFSQAHAESTAGGISVAIEGSLGSPIKLICANDAAEPPTAVATTATITTTGNNGITLFNSGGYGILYGLSFIVASGGSSGGTITLGGLSKTMDSCNITLASTDAAAIIRLLSSGAYTALLRNCGFKFGHASQSLDMVSGVLRVQGGSLLAGGTSPTTLLFAQSDSKFVFEGFDLSNASAGINLVSAAGQRISGVFRNCELPASWSGALNVATVGGGSVFEMFNCDSGDTNYRYRKAAEFGTVQDETTIVRTGGANNGTTNWSLKMVANGSALYPQNTIDIPERVRWNDTVGTPITLTVEFVHDSLTNLKDNEIWLEVDYLGTSGVPISTHVSDAAATLLTTAADQTDSSETWTTTGLTNPNTQKLSVTFTPQEAGYIHYVVKLAKLNTTVYVDPKATIS
jgi:hypothetical protein